MNAVVARALSAYDLGIKKRPMQTKAATCLVGFALGDIAAQYLAPPKVKSVHGVQVLSKEYSVARTVSMGTFGALLAAPQMHIFFTWLEKVVMPKSPKHPAAVLLKVAIDQVVNSPIGTVVFLAWTQILKGTPERTGSEINSKLWPTTRASWTVWPTAQAVNFLLIPVQFRIVFINIVAIAWSCFLSEQGNS